MVKTKYGDAVDHLLMNIGVRTATNNLVVSYNQFGRTSDDGKVQHPSLTIVEPLFDPANGPLVSFARILYKIFFGICHVDVEQLCYSTLGYSGPSRAQNIPNVVLQDQKSD